MVKTRRSKKERGLSRRGGRPRRIKSVAAAWGPPSPPLSTHPPHRTHTTPTPRACTPSFPTRARGRVTGWRWGLLSSIPSDAPSCITHNTIPFPCSFSFLPPASPGPPRRPAGRVCVHTRAVWTAPRGWGGGGGVDELRPRECGHHLTSLSTHTHRRSRRSQVDNPTHPPTSPTAPTAPAPSFATAAQHEEHGPREQGAYRVGGWMGWGRKEKGGCGRGSSFPEPRWKTPRWQRERLALSPYTCDAYMTLPCGVLSGLGERSGRALCVLPSNRPHPSTHPPTHPTYTTAQPLPPPHKVTKHNGQPH